MSDESKKEEKKSAVKASAKVTKFIEEVEKLSVLELAELVKALEDKFGVSAVPAVAAGVGPAAAATAGGAPAPVEEKTEFDVVLTDGGANKIGVIKALREIKPELGLVEAKTFVESTPKKVLEGAKKDDAESAKKKLEEAGAQVELK